MAHGSWLKNLSGKRQVIRILSVFLNGFLLPIEKKLIRSYQFSL
jgi:hypothetical protein